MSKVISVSEENYELIKAQKRHYREPFNDVVSRLLGKEVAPKNPKPTRVKTGTKIN